METEAVLLVESKMIIKNGNIFTKDGKFQKGHIYICEDRIEKLVYTQTTDEVFEGEPDAEGLYILPGLVDIHFHGAGGYDFCEATTEAFSNLEEYQIQHGITTVFPATMTLDESTLQNILKKAAEYVSFEGKGVIEGITLEGPFLSETKRGAQNKASLRKPDVDFYRQMQQISDNLIKQVAVAPEEDSDMTFISEVSKEVVVSLAHSAADYEIASEAFESGANHVTHLFNGMNPFLHREPGIVGAALDNQSVFVELIGDGVHIHPTVVRAMFQLFGPERICMISDSLSATGMPDGEYCLGGQKVLKKGEFATLEDGTLAGSVSNLYECMKKAVLEMQIPLEHAILACTKTPAKSLGVDDKCGILEEGRKADILILDKNLEIKYVIKNGKMVRDRN